MGARIQQSRGTRPCQLPLGPWPGKVPHSHAKPLPVRCLVHRYTPEAAAQVSSRRGTGVQTLRLAPGRGMRGMDEGPPVALLLRQREPQDALQLLLLLACAPPLLLLLLR